MNDDLISRKAVLGLPRSITRNFFEEIVEESINVKEIEALPSAQPEIIHCRECKHWREGDAYSYCDKLFSMGVLDVYDYMASEDDFCSNAERRTDD